MAGMVRRSLAVTGRPSAVNRASDMSKTASCWSIARLRGGAGRRFERDTGQMEGDQAAIGLGQVVARGRFELDPTRAGLRHDRQVKVDDARCQLLLSHDLVIDSDLDHPRQQL